MRIDLPVLAGMLIVAAVIGAMVLAIISEQRLARRRAAIERARQQTPDADGPELIPSPTPPTAAPWQAPTACRPWCRPRRRRTPWVVPWPPDTGRSSGPFPPFGWWR